MGSIARLRLEELVGEREGRIELQSVGLGAQSIRKRSHRSCGRSALFRTVRRSRLSDIRTSSIGDFAYLILLDRRMRHLLTGARK